MLRETKLRSVLKTLSWRILATVTTMTLVLVMTGTWAIALSVGGMEILGKLLLYYFHERAWQRLSWGFIPANNLTQPQNDSFNPVSGGLNQLNNMEH